MNQPEPGLSFGHKVGEGVKIVRSTDSIEVILRGIKETKEDSRIVTFSISGLPGLDTLDLTVSDKFHRLTRTGDIAMRVAKDCPQYMLGEGRVCVRYLIQSDYIIESITQSKTKPHFLQ